MAARSKAARWFAAALVAAIAIWAYRHYQLGALLNFESLQRSREALVALVEQRPWQTAGGFFAVYVAATALSIPGALILTLAAGAMFGLGWGLLIVSFASSLGALGTPESFTVAAQGLRGGMTLRRYRIKFKDRTLRLTTFVMPDGKLEQYQIAHTE